MNKARGTIEIAKSLEVEIERDLGTLFSRMTNLSMSEVESLIDELQRLRTKLEIDGALIERAIARHSEHSQGVM